MPVDAIHEEFEVSPYLIRPLRTLNAATLDIYKDRARMRNIQYHREMKAWAERQMNGPKRCL